MFIFKTKKVCLTSCLGFTLVISPLWLRLAEANVGVKNNSLKRATSITNTLKPSVLIASRQKQTEKQQTKRKTQKIASRPSQQPSISDSSLNYLVAAGIEMENALDSMSYDSVYEQDQPPKHLLHGKTVAWDHEKPHSICPNPSDYLNANVPTESKNEKKTSHFSPGGLKHQLARVFKSLLASAGIASSPDNPSEINIQVAAVENSHSLNDHTAMLENSPQGRISWVVWNNTTELASTAATSSTTSVLDEEEEEEEQFVLRVNGEEVIELNHWPAINDIADRLEKQVKQKDFKAQKITPGQIGGTPAIFNGDRILFVADDSLFPENEINVELLVINWVNNLRLALGGKSLDLVEAQQEMYNIVETEQEFEGTASWYGPYFHGRLTANGETYNQEDFTAAHLELPFNTYLKITNLENQETVILRINDRGPYIPPRTLDLSKGVARCLNSKSSGVIPYRAVIMSQAPE